MARFIRVLCFFLLSSLLSAQVNFDFEATPVGAYTTSNAVTGWAVHSQIWPQSCTSAWLSGSAEFSIVSTPYSGLDFPLNFTGTIPHSPLGGQNIARLNNQYSTLHTTRLSRSFTITPASSLITFAVAGAWDFCGSDCCRSSGFKVAIKDQFGVEQTCHTIGINTSTNITCNPPSTSYTNTNYTYWKNWQVHYMDLSHFMGSFMTLEVTSSDCRLEAHRGCLFFDATCGPSLKGVNFCPGSSQAVLNAPLGYASYSWIPSGAPLSPAQATLSSLTLTNAVASSVYTVYFLSYSGCPFITTYTLTPSQVSITAVSSSSSCIGGFVGSSTVTATGSSSGYSYNWVSATNSVVGTGPVANNLAPGMYTVSITASGSASLTCGNATATTLVNAIPQNFTSLTKLACNITPTLCVPGTSVQWYLGNTPVGAAQGGTASCLAIPIVINGSVFRAGYSLAGCRDSVAYTMSSNVTPGNISTYSPNLICAGASNGSVVVTLTVASGVTPGSNSFSITSTGSTPPYVSGIGASSSTQFTVNGLQEGTYNISVSDGMCAYSQTLAVAAHHFDYSFFIPQNTVCAGTMPQASVIFTAPVSQSYSYSWTPSTFLFNPATNPVVILPAVTPPATAAVIVYSTTVTHILSKCALTKTLSITMLNPSPPVINPIPSLCDHPSSTHTISVNPPGGTFSGNFTFTPVGGVLNGSKIPPGQHTVIFTTNACGMVPAQTVFCGMKKL